MHAELLTAGGVGGWLDLPWDLLADIHRRLRFTDRLAFTAVFGDLFKPEAPWLVLPKKKPDQWEYNKTTFFSLADRRVTSVRACPLRDYALLGSSGGWLAMADKEGRLQLVNPVTGKQHELPSLTTMVGLNVTSSICSNSLKVFSFKKEEFLAIRFDDRSYDAEHWRPYPSTVETRSSEMGDRVLKVVLSASARPSSYTAMLIMGWQGYRVPAFVTAEYPAWRVAPPRDDVVDAVHHRGRFYSLSRSGDVGAWDEKELTSEMVTSSGLAGEGNKRLATTPDGRLMAVLWADAATFGRSYLSRSSKRSFKVQVLDDPSGSWQETDDIGPAALLVGADNSIMCVSTREHQKLTRGIVYFTDEVEGEVRVYSLQHRRLYPIEGFEDAEGWAVRWNAAAWFMPSIS